MGAYIGVNSFFKKNSYFCTHGFLPIIREKNQKMYKENTLNENTFSEMISSNCALQYTAAEHEHLFGRRDMT